MKNKKGLASVFAGLIFVGTALWTSYQKDASSLGHFLLAISLVVLIAGIGLSFSKKERERAVKRATKDLQNSIPKSLNVSSDFKIKRRGRLLLIIGITLFIFWTYFFGFSSLSTY